MKKNLLSRLGVRLATQMELARGVDDQDFLALYRQEASFPPSVLLASAGTHELSRFSFAGLDPFLVFRAKGASVTLTTAAGEESFTAEGLDVLDQLLAAARPDFDACGLPFMGGAMGYLAYELKNQIERLPQTAIDDLGLPDIFLIFPSRLFIHDRAAGTVRQIRFETPELCATPVRLAGRKPVHAGGGPSLASNFTHAAYLRAVARVREYIAQGDVYQVNLSQRFSGTSPCPPLQLFERLMTRNPAPFYAFIQAGEHDIISTSMERFILREGSFIETRPIKGTRRRGKTQTEDQGLREELSRSPKDDAELSMIVDLLRNDLGRVCEPRGVTVSQHKRVEAFENVHHLVSVVSGRLGPGVTAGQILRAAFPGGSITGCPKIRAMEIIDELEPQVRHVYTGSIGYLGWHENMDLSIAIRTAIHAAGRLHLSVGGGIVYDSNEEDEFQETLTKGRTFFEVLGENERN